MKNYILLFAAFTFLDGNAQITEEKRLPVDPQTNRELRYYYFPNMEAYYDLKNELYVYQQNNTWTTSASLPPHYCGYSLYKNEKVVLTDFTGDNPEQLIKEHRKLYPYNSKGRIKRPDQPILSESPTALIE